MHLAIHRGAAFYRRRMGLRNGVRTLVSCYTLFSKNVVKLSSAFRNIVYIKDDVRYAFKT